MHKIFRAIVTFALFCASQTPVSALFFDGILFDLMVIEKMNEENRNQLANGVKKLWNGTPEESVQHNKDAAAPTDAKSNEPQTFNDLPGMPEDIREVIEFFNNGERFSRVGARMPKGILLYGPPGTGKTSAAKVIAKQCSAAFFECSASSFMELYVGSGPQHVRKIFADANEHEKAVIFIDEIDAIGGNRGSGMWENSERTNTLNELLSQMDGFKSHKGLLIIAATNRIDILDEALLRPGRFDRLIKLELPNATVRNSILERYVAHILFTGSHDYLKTIAQQTEGFSGADLKNIVDEAAIFAARENAEGVGDLHIKKALEKAFERPRTTKNN
jgi:cell division protease FtsH